MDLHFHSVTLDVDKCKGCINCIKRCPTEAIRVREGKAKITPERCIDCGECIRVCPHHAKKAIHDHLSDMKEYKYKIALPAPAFYAQFNHITDINTILDALINMGFDAVYEVAKAAEIVSELTDDLMAKNSDLRPIISSACPAVTRLIRVRFPHLLHHVLPINAPVELAARLAVEEALEKTTYKREEIGTFFISPCPAKVTASRMPLGTEKSEIDKVLAISEVYKKILPLMSASPEQKISTSGARGVNWGRSGGEAAALQNEDFLAADGIENVIKVLEDLEDDKFDDLQFIELNACSGGCVGGVLTVENPYIAKTKLSKIKKILPKSTYSRRVPTGIEIFDIPLSELPVFSLSDDISKAMDMMIEIDEILETLPLLDCGTCGSPSCKAFAEDIVRGIAKKDDCVVLMREKLESEIVPLPFRKGELK